MSYFGDTLRKITHKLSSASLTFMSPSSASLVATEPTVESQATGPAVAPMSVIESQAADAILTVSSQSSPPSTLSDIHFVDSPCLSCDDPCTDHEQLPGYLASKIDNETPLLGTLKPYQQHILVRVGTGKRWAEKLGSTPNAFLSHVDAAIDALGLPFRTLITAFECEDDEDVEPEDTNCTQILLFPQNIALDKVRVADIPKMVEHMAAFHTSTDLGESAVASGDMAVPTSSLAHFPEAFVALTEAHVWKYTTTIMVCTHKKRDKRCGVAGPMLIKEFGKSVKELGMEPNVGIFGVSHFGGHRFAGGLIVYRSFSNGDVVGDWYGRVKTCHVLPILETTVQKNMILRDLWRGRMDNVYRKNEKERKAVSW
ncbi:hypothetical protein BASA50_007902 [Batrachochytrium salamandrivorans]|uniref:Sucrase/ferredoxin-like-domain-containing protein n=1 Tax=Batrachochytrium salamandrivorans TaxID=1357716 RepID=A0ABQ8F8Y8_9FUNG|nr:hypothetical protein BASA62_003013 [Batrachochytrium salamandrivorans]KAH6581688.1 hypothetical protein BASA60_002275 [Batrachochytrium salamandrivorans]KAH6592723.1 hypothetical protein BASA50_007902 [Batrachochytrium salamandrivorans]KAH6602341.1 hypothetical protein BASA61_001215 [Batrachochytrium salamandrivorans]KAH9246399.1 hypothetical protein BASA81_016063 [Batrachochytrium salamandrivorans]